VASVSRSIEAALDREKEDFELEVGSAGLTSPFKVRGQYDKNIGNEVEVLTADGRKLRGILAETTDEGFTITYKVKEKPEGAKRPVLVDHSETFAYSQAKKVTYCIDFK
ncbi:MAG: ribosome assembly cofactor RimP, partial [Muribaculaceae bacterium]|nr:ribosome assembly cofactor RimP [Muribaculaceae bacterium]